MVDFTTSYGISWDQEMTRSLIKQGISDTKKPTLGGLFCLFIKNEFGAATGLYYLTYQLD